MIPHSMEWISACGSEDKASVHPIEYHGESVHRLHQSPREHMGTLKLICGGRTAEAEGRRYTDACGMPD